MAKTDNLQKSIMRLAAIHNAYARAKSLTPLRRSEIAKLAAMARWAKAKKKRGAA